MAPLPPDLPAGRRRRGRLAVDRPGRLRPARPGRPADPGRRQALHRGQDRRRTQQQQGQPQQFVLAIRPHDGKMLWKTEVGTFRQGQQFFYYGMTRHVAPAAAGLPRGGDLRRHARRRPGAARRRVRRARLGLRLPDRPGPVDGPVLLLRRAARSRRSASSPPLPVGEALLIKGAQSDRLYAVEPDRMKVLWERPIAKASRLLGADDRAVFLGGPELSALDLKTRTLLWATRLPGGSIEGRVLVRPDGLWQLTPRGIFEIDPIGRGPADLPRRRPGLRRRRPVPDRPLARWPSPTARSRPTRAGRPRPRSPPATSPAPRRRGLRMSKSSIAAVVLVAGAARRVGPARAQFFGPNAGVGRGREHRGLHGRRQGDGRGQAEPVEIDLEVSAASELTADAIVKYRDARRKLQEAFTALKLGNVAVEERGLLVDQKGQADQPLLLRLLSPTTRTKTEVQLSRKLVVNGDRHPQDGRGGRAPARRQAARRRPGRRRPGRRRRTTSIPTTTDRYNQQNSGLVRFVLDDFDKLQEEAYEKAIADARTRAERLARLSRVELGPIVAVREVVVPGETATSRRGQDDDDEPAQAAGGVQVPGDPGPRRAAGAVRGPIPRPRPRDGRQTDEHPMIPTDSRSGAADPPGRSWPLPLRPPALAGGCGLAAGSAGRPRGRARRSCPST